MGREPRQNNPLKMSCKNCGAPIRFDIIRQNYHCGYCGQIEGIPGVKAAEKQWRMLQKNRLQQEFAGQELQEYACSSCGATIVFRAGEAASACDFCKSQLIRKELTMPEEMPSYIIPFFITYQEAKERLKQWALQNKKKKEAGRLLSNLNKLQGYYLPYQLVHGPIQGNVSRDGNFRQFYCGGYLNGVAVNASKQLDNIVLNAAEPFDWSAVRDFEYGYLTGCKVKLRDISDSELEKRIQAEMEREFLPEIEKVLQTSGVSVRIGAGNTSVLSALLPMYFIKEGRFLAVLNGQTGKIAVSEEKEEISFPWMIEPALYTLLLTLLVGYFFHFDPYPMFLAGILFGVMLFVIFGQGRVSLIRRVINTSQDAKASRKERKLEIKEEKGIVQNPFAVKPVFLEQNQKGMMVPVKIRFYGFWRVLSILINMILLVGAPVLVAAGIRWLMVLQSGEGFWENFHIANGAVWYVFAGFMAIVYWAKGVRKDAYEHPIIHEILPDGRLRLMGSRKSRRLSFFTMFDGEGSMLHSKNMSFIGRIQALGGIGIFLVCMVLFFFLGSVGAMLL